MATDKRQVQIHAGEDRLECEVVEKLLFGRRISEESIWNSGIRNKKDLEKAILKKYPECKQATCIKRVGIIWPKIKEVIDARKQADSTGVYSCIQKNEAIAYIHAESRISAENMLRTLLQGFMQDIEIRLEIPGGSKNEAISMNTGLCVSYMSKKRSIDEQIASLKVKSEYQEFMSRVCEDLSRV